MATTYNHIRMSEVDSSGNVRVMYPETTGADVTISRSGNNNIPSSVTTAQTLANALAASAFTNPISDSTTTTTSTWSSNKINTAVTNISVYVGSSDGKLHFVNSAGTDKALSFSSASGTATAAQVLTGYTFSNSSGKGLSGEMPNKGAWTGTVSGGSSVTIPAGYHNGSGYVSGSNYNSSTYTFSSGSTGSTVDMGSSNSYRYVNATNVYNAGKSAGTTTHTGTYTYTSSDSDTVDLNAKAGGVDHNYRYVNANARYSAGYSSGHSSGYNSGYNAGYDEGKHVIREFTALYTTKSADSSNPLGDIQLTYNSSRGYYLLSTRYPYKGWGWDLPYDSNYVKIEKVSSTTTTRTYRITFKKDGYYWLPSDSISAAFSLSESRFQYKVATSTVVLERDVSTDQETAIVFFYKDLQPI